MSVLRERRTQAPATPRQHLAAVARTLHGPVVSVAGMAATLLDVARVEEVTHLVQQHTTPTRARYQLWSTGAPTKRGQSGGAESEGFGWVGMLFSGLYGFGFCTERTESSLPLATI